MKLSIKHRIFIFLLNFISKTWRINVIGKSPKHGIVVFWHGKMLPGWYNLRKQKPVAVVSQSKDGEILSVLLERWSYSLIRGSSSKGGKEVLNSIVKNAKNQLVLMTPDGPRGPAKELKAGAIIASQRAKVPLTLCGISIKNKLIFRNSWDNFEFPLPFTKIIVKYSNSYYIEESENRNLTEQKIKDIEQLLNEINENI